jgi:hypothetical protein
MMYMQKMTYQIVQQVLELISFSYQTISSITHTLTLKKKRKKEKRDDKKMDKWEGNEKGQDKEKKKQHMNENYE